MPTEDTLENREENETREGGEGEILILSSDNCASLVLAPDICVYSAPDIGAVAPGLLDNRAPDNAGGCRRFADSCVQTGRPSFRMVRFKQDPDVRFLAAAPSPFIALNFQECRRPHQYRNRKIYKKQRFCN